jgi:transcriptional regulator with XRE-family HTH domain
MRLLRAGKGISQEQLADLAGLHRTYIGSIERGERNVSIDNIEKLANALGVTVSDLVGSGAR